MLRQWKKPTIHPFFLIDFEEMIHKQCAFFFRLIISLNGMKLREIMALLSNLFLRMIQQMYLDLQALVESSWMDDDDYIHMAKPLGEEGEKEENKNGFYDVIWLVSTNEIGENIKFIEKLREIILRLKIFDNVDKCQEYINQLSTEIRLIMIISDVKHIEIIRQIYHLRQISSIYICCTEIIVKQQWMSYCPKVKSFYWKFLIRNGFRSKEFSMISMN